MFQRCLHSYTITHAIEDRNVLRFHIDYYKPEGDKKLIAVATNVTPKQGETVSKQKVIETILAKHEAATADRKFNAVLATGSINDAIEYYALFKSLQGKRTEQDTDFLPLNIACVFSPPAEGDRDVQQSQTLIRGFSISIPWDIEEQASVADCLSSADELIAAETRQLEALKTHKQGLMQQLFPAEGETVPRLRFPEFLEAGSWVPKMLGELLNQEPDYGLNAAGVPYSPSLPTFLRITDISDNGYILPAGRVSVDAAPPREYFLNPGDIVLARTGASVGKTFRYREDDGPLVFAGYLIRIKPDPAKVHPVLLANIFYSDGYWEWVHINSPRSGQPGINATEFASFPLMLPADNNGKGLQEQQRIAEALDAMDDAIRKQASRIELLKVHQQGLMQQLFPIMDEVQA